MSLLHYFYINKPTSVCVCVCVSEREKGGRDGELNRAMPTHRKKVGEKKQIHKS